MNTFKRYTSDNEYVNNGWTLKYSYCMVICVKQLTCNSKHGISLDKQTDTTDLMIELYNQFMLNERLIDLSKKIKISVKNNITNNNVGVFNDIGLRMMDKWVYVTVGDGLRKELEVGIRFISLEKEYVSSWIAILLEVYRIFRMNKQHPIRIKHLIDRSGKELIKLTHGFRKIRTTTPPKYLQYIRIRNIDTINWDTSKNLKHDLIFGRFKTNNKTLDI